MQKDNSIPVELNLTCLIPKAVKTASGGPDKTYPVIDLFAGPGGLGEGFAIARDHKKRPRFRSSVSIEQDSYSHQTLLLRHFFRQFLDGEAPREYYDFLAGKITATRLFTDFPEEYSHAQETAQKITLGEKTHAQVRELIGSRLKGQKWWALVGGPPCQAYSLVGRSKMKNDTQFDFENDHRHTLYREYLKIVADHRPPVFVMENVKGLLSAKFKGESTINLVLRDLRYPHSAVEGAPESLRYKLYSLVTDVDKADGKEIDPADFLVHAEDHGIPQARHRMFIVGVRDDIDVKPEKLKRADAPTLKDVIGSLPKLRSELSRGRDSREKWKAELLELSKIDFPREWGNSEKHQKLRRLLMLSVLKEANHPWASSSSKYEYRRDQHSKVLRSLADKKLTVLTGHESRSHMPDDLRRYLFSALYARVFRRSPRLKDFPKGLLPKHKNVGKALDGSMFNDRFRVQLANDVSTTITSHISKDGHYFIHYDPEQCRSLTVREAARLQTFPDNYFFAGPKTEQYHQVGNAVPVQLAKQIAEIVANVLDRASKAKGR